MDELQAVPEFKVHTGLAIALEPTRSILHLSPNVRVEGTTSPPNWWWRMWQWVLLGWWWEAR